MLKLHQIFFYNFIGIFFVSFLLETAISYLFLREIEISNSKAHLQSAINLAEMQLVHTTNFDTLANDVHRATQLRFTLIAEDGSILAESNENKQMMDNHANRDEVIASRIDAYGFAIRYSHTLRENYLYVAKKIHLDEQDFFIRMSVSLQQIREHFIRSWMQISAIFAFLIFIAFLVSYKISKRVRTDVEKLTHYLKEISNKNYKAPLKTTFSKEFYEIAFTLKRVISKLERRERQKRKYTAKLRLINKQRNDMLSAISHEFKNPLAAIQGYAQTLQNEDIQCDNRNLFYNFLEKIVLNSQKITTMIDRIALSIKLENQDLEPHFQAYSIVDITHDALATIKKKYPTREVIVEAEDNIFQMDPTMIEMVLINLMDNALKYSEKDIRVKISNRRVAIIDHGIGIDQEELEQIQSKFYRVEKNTWDNSMGLGLAIVGYILRLHHSKLEIQSQLGQGSIFSFDIKSFSENT